MPIAKVLSSQPLAQNLVLLKLKPEPALAFKAGQFVIVPVPPDPSAPPPPKPPKGFYSIASAEQDPEIELLIERREGHVSQWMASRSAGDGLELEGPLGKFALREPLEGQQIFLATRAGLAPLRSMILSALKSGGSQHLQLFLGAHGAGELLFDAQWRGLAAAHPNFHYHPVVQPTQENPFFGKNQDPADELIKKMTRREGMDLYLAGFNAEVEPMLAKLLAAGFGKERIRVEKFG